MYIHTVGRKAGCVYLHKDVHVCMHVCMYSSQILRANAGACYDIWHICLPTSSILVHFAMGCVFTGIIVDHTYFFFLKHIRTLIPKSISEPLFLQKFHSVNPFNLNGNCCEPGRAQFAEEKREFPSQVVSKTCSILFSSKFGLFSNPFSGRARWTCLYPFLSSWCNWSASSVAA